MKETYRDGWFDGYFAAYADAWQSGDYREAFHLAFDSARKATDVFSQTGDARAQYNRAVLYSLAAIAAEAAGMGESLVLMYFMTRLVLAQIGPLWLVRGNYKSTLKELMTRLEQLKPAVAGNGVDPDQRARTFLNTWKAANSGSGPSGGGVVRPDPDAGS